MKCIVQELLGSLTSTLSNCTTSNSSNDKGCSGSLMDLIRSETKNNMVMSLWEVGVIMWVWLLIALVIH